MKHLILFLILSLFISLFVVAGIGYYLSIEEKELYVAFFVLSLSGVLLGGLIADKIF